MTSRDEMAVYLRRGLVGNHVDLYQNSAEFHAEIEVLMRMLPICVDALAAAASAAYMARHEEILRVMNQGPPPVKVNDDGSIG